MSEPGLANHYPPLPPSPPSSSSPDNITPSERPLALEMDTLSSSPSRSRSRGKSPFAQVDRRAYAIGIALLLIVVVLWTSSNFLTQDLFVGGYAKPFFVTYLNTSSFALYLIPFAVRRVWRREQAGLDQAPSGPRDEYQPLVEEDTSDQAHSNRSRNVYVPSEIPSLSALPPLTVRETIHLSSVFCFFWFIANWSVNAALDYTSVASATILSSMSGFFTLAIGRLFKVETLTVAKIGAVVTSFGGVLLVSLSDSQQSQPASLAGGDQPHRLLGDFLALLSAFFYAVYVTLLKVRIRSESRIDMQLFFGFVGLFNIISCWPIGVVLHFAGIERFELPSTGKTVAALLINMVITLSSDYIYVLAMLKTTPLVVTIGLSLTMPLAVVGDLMLGHAVKFKVIIGAVLVLASFVVVGIEDSKVDAEEVLNAANAEDTEAERTVRGRRSRVRWRDEVEVVDIEPAHVDDR
ncbi:hypothetical protein EW146_g590 [Bondarzewia mesenterica]|uniref:DUF3955 domain-containing protein n=1 Tax=Bondarzewia mesenterica TaxID=1095465 RepID=A0A4S4MCR1_9AGAM|nr:hypothetical protein EW146_g590 [Bondarzewia mesenterica]